MMSFRSLTVVASLSLLASASAWSPRAVVSMGMSRKGALLQAGKVLAGAAALGCATAPALAEEITTDTGLTYTVLKEGTGAIPAAGQTVRVHYSGWLDGFDGSKKFDSSYDRMKPLMIPAGVGRVIAGWDEMLLTMKVGEKRNVVIPPSMGYGKRGAGGVIPPDATLYFTMELISIN